MHIPIYNKNGEQIGKVIDNAPMPDFASTHSNSAVATLVLPQYGESVQHNTGYGEIPFGNNIEHNPHNDIGNPYEYQIVKINEYPNDYHITRLGKLVTETAPANLELEYRPEFAVEYKNSDRYTQFARLGSGGQSVRDKNGNTTDEPNINSGMVGGVPMTIRAARNERGRNWLDPMGSKNMRDDVYGPMQTFAQGGDSGSPLYAYDAKTGRWNVIAAMSSIAKDDSSVYTTLTRTQPDLIFAHQKDDTLTIHGNTLTWQNKAAGTSTLTTDGVAQTVNIQDPTLPNVHRDRQSLHHGKTLEFMDDINLNIQGDIHQEAGALWFRGDGQVTGGSYQGGGISVDKDKTVHWGVKGVDGDRLSKIGAGRLVVEHTGTNMGDISVGDGVVELNAQPDNAGNVQAFNRLGIVSGRPIVKLVGANQMDFNNLYFGFLGGKLDINGNDIAVNRIRHFDKGATIINSGSKASITLNQGLESYGFLGSIIGDIDLIFKPFYSDTVLFLSGQNAIDTLTINNGAIKLSGAPTPHAKLKENPYSLSPDIPDNFKEHDWQNGHFIANTINLKKGSLHVGRNLSKLQANINAKPRTTIELGHIQNISSHCVRSYYTGYSLCTQDPLSQTVYDNLTPTQVFSDITLEKNASLSVGKASWFGTLNAQGSKQGSLSLHNDSHFYPTLGRANYINTLNMQGGHLHLQPTSSLVVGGDLTGTGNLHFDVDKTTLEHGKLHVDGNILGNHAIFVRATGAEPTQASKRLPLISGNNQANFSLFEEGTTQAVDSVDLGAYRYRGLKL